MAPRSKPAMCDPVVTLTRILLEHRERRHRIRSGPQQCACGWVSEHHGQTYHLIHVARMIAAELDLPAVAREVGEGVPDEP